MGLKASIFSTYDCGDGRIKSDQNGIERLTFWNTRYLTFIEIKSDQNGIESVTAGAGEVITVKW